MNEIRVQRTIKLLQSIPAKSPHFDMTDWGSCAVPVVLPELTEAVLRDGCGTAACALGWAASTEEARAEGLRLVWDGRIAYFAYYVRYQPPGEIGGYAGLEAAKAYFEFESAETAEFLFSPSSYDYGIGIPAATVATRMQAILDKGEGAIYLDSLRFVNGPSSLRQLAGSPD